jgi:hypothetical protein
MTTHEEIVRAAIVREAEEWVGTPFGHGQSVKGVMVDCAHFIEELIMRAVGGLLSPVIVEPYKRREDGTVMLRLLEENMDMVASLDEAKPGDVVALIGERLDMPDEPRHLAVMSRRRADGTVFIIHAGDEEVVQHRINLHWKNRIHSIWKIRDFDASVVK